MSGLSSSKRKVAFVVNPHAGMGAAGKQWPQIRALARDRLGAILESVTTGPGDASRMTREALLGGAKTIVCVGGDGALHEVVNGFMGEHGPVEPEALLGFIPIGTGCDFVKTVSVPKQVDRAMEVICRSHVRSIDLGRLQYLDHDGHRTSAYFHNVVSFGLGGEVVERVNRTTKAFGGFVSFIWATLISLLLYSKKRIRLRVDDTFDDWVVTWNVAVANGQYHGGGMWVAPDALVDDGLFQVTVIGNFNLLEVFRHLPKLYNGKLFVLRKVRSLAGRRVEACSDQQVLLDVDGEQPGTLPAAIHMVPQALRLITPE
jgi:YegS/Rv2252/BmrU family lipid kinase